MPADLPEIDPKHLPTGTTAFDTMTLRDWFAGQALAGIVATGEIAPPEDDRAAKWAYGYAAAMLKRRSLPAA